MDNVKRVTRTKRLRNKKSAAQLLNDAYEDGCFGERANRRFEPFLRALGEVIKANTYNRSDFAKSVNLSRTHLYNLMNGKKNPTIDTLASLLEKLGLTIQVIPMPENCKKKRTVKTGRQ